MKNVVFLNVVLLVLVMCLTSCSSSDDSSSLSNNGEVLYYPVAFNPDNIGEQLIIGKWRVTKDGVGDQTNQNEFIEFCEDGQCKYEIHVGNDDYYCLTSNYGFEDGWTFDVDSGKFEGLIICCFRSFTKYTNQSWETAYVCTVQEDEMSLIPKHSSDNTIYYYVAPAIHLSKVK